MPKCIILNLYGSTEVAADATCAQLPGDDVADQLPLVACGRAISNVRVEVREVNDSQEHWTLCSKSQECCWVEPMLFEPRLSLRIPPSK